MILLQWTLFYATPALIAVLLARTQEQFKIRMAIVHIFLIVSIGLLSVAGARLALEFHVWSIALTITSLLFAIYLLRSVGVGYALSSFIQQWCLLLAGVWIIPTSGIIIGTCATALVYALAHCIDHSSWIWKLPLTFLWGVCSLLIYLWLQQPLLTISLHAFLGSILIYRELLYERL